MTKTNAEYKIVYRMDYAMKLKSKGHIIDSTMPNPKNNKYNVWIFKNDETFDADLKELISKDSRKEG